MSSVKATARSPSPAPKGRGRSATPTRGRASSSAGGTSTASGKKSAGSKKISTLKSKRSPSPSTSERSSEKYRQLFNDIDVDHSGFIDAVELYAAAARAFPNARVTPAAIKRLLQEADENHDGVISYKEFAHVLGKAEVKHDLWSKLSGLSRVKHELDEAFVVADGALEPIRHFSRQHSSDTVIVNETSEHVRVQQATVGLRYLNFLVFVYWAVGIFSFTYALVLVAGHKEMLPDLWKYLPFILFFYDITSYFEGQDLPMYILGLQVVDRTTGKPLNFFQTLLWITLSRYVFVVFDWVVLLLAGGTSLDYFLNAIVVIKTTPHRPLTSDNVFSYIFMVGWLLVFLDVGDDAIAWFSKK
jgi:EF-hand domain pair